MIKAVLFDMDGTVFDTERIYREAWFFAAEAVGFDEMEELLARVFGTSEKDIGTYVYKTYGEDFPYEKMLGIRAELIQKRIEENGVPFKKGVPEVFARLREKGIRSALVTSAPAFRVKDFLTRSGLDACFSAVITGERVNKSKPAPDIFIEAAVRIGADPLYTVVCEDSINGIRGAHRAAMKPIMVVDRLAPTEETEELCYAICNSLFDVMELIKKENKIN